MRVSQSIFSPLRAWKMLLKKPVTISRKDIFITPREASDRYRGFHANDQEKCTGCGTCAEICPTAAINLVYQAERPLTMGKTQDLPTFDYGRCSFCGLCVDICTSDSLSMTKEYIHLTTDPNDFIFMPDHLGIHGQYFAPGYVRDQDSELLDLTRYPIDEIPHEGRNLSFMELIKGYSHTMALAESSRCVACGVCTATCPAHMHIPEYIQAIYDGEINKGIQWLYETNPLPNVCGRICTHLCESACVLNNRGEPIAIRWLKRYLIDQLHPHEVKALLKEQMGESKQKSIAVVGSGPAGLSAAYYLTTLGYHVTIFESKAQAGGVVRYGAPEYRLPDDKVTEDIDLITALGVTIKTHTALGRDVTLSQLKSDFDAVFIATGMWQPKKLNIPHNDHPDLVYSTDFLAQARDYRRGLMHMPHIQERCLVIGGGDVSFDVARTLVRFQLEKFGTHDVVFIARKDEAHLAASREEVVEARDEGVEYLLNASPQAIEVDPETGKITGVTVAKATTTPTDDGKVTTQVDSDDCMFVPGSQVFFAVGSAPDYAYLDDFPEIKDQLRGSCLAVNDMGQVKGFDWLFAGGDIVKGPDIISAIADGHRAAKGIDAYLNPSH